MNSLNINGMNIDNIRYVDDTTLLVSNKEDLRKIFDVVKKASEQNGVNKNVKRTTTMVIGRNEVCVLTLK